MHSLAHPLLSVTPDALHCVTSHHFGEVRAGGRKMYIQAALHADETPAMLVAVKLKEALNTLEAQERLRAEIVLVPVVDPVNGERWPVASRDDGIFYMGRDVRFARHGDPLGRVSGNRTLRTGVLLGA